MHMERAALGKYQGRSREQGWSVGSGSIVRTFLGVFSVFSIGRSRALQAGVYSAGSKTVRVKRPRHDGYSAEPLLIWIARKKVCLSPFFQEWSAGSDMKRGSRPDRPMIARGPPPTPSRAQCRKSVFAPPRRLRAICRCSFTALTVDF